MWLDDFVEQGREPIQPLIATLRAWGEAPTKSGDTIVPSLLLRGAAALESLSTDLYGALAHALFIIKCQQDGIEIGEKLPDGIAGIEMLLARVWPPQLRGRDDVTDSGLNAGTAEGTLASSEPNEQEGAA